MGEPRRQRLSHTVRSLRELAVQLLSLADEFTRLVELSADESDPPDELGVLARPTVKIDRQTFSVSWTGRVCPLGNGLPFRVLEVLARRPGRYVSVADLMDDVWAGTRSPTAVRTVVSNLRMRLRRAGMPDLADLIDGRCRDHYRLALPTDGGRTDRKQTAGGQGTDSSMRGFRGGPPRAGR